MTSLEAVPLLRLPPLTILTLHLLESSERSNETLQRMQNTMATSRCHLQVSRRSILHLSTSMALPPRVLLPIVPNRAFMQPSKTTKKHLHPVEVDRPHHQPSEVHSV